METWKTIYCVAVISLLCVMWAVAIWKWIEHKKFETIMMLLERTEGAVTWKVDRMLRSYEPDLKTLSKKDAIRYAAILGSLVDKKENL